MWCSVVRNETHIIITWIQWSIGGKTSQRGENTSRNKELCLGDCSFEAHKWGAEGETNGVSIEVRQKARRVQRCNCKTNWDERCVSRVDRVVVRIEQLALADYQHE